MITLQTTCSYSSAVYIYIYRNILLFIFLFVCWHWNDLSTERMLHWNQKRPAASGQIWTAGQIWSLLQQSAAVRKRGRKAELHVSSRIWLWLVHTPRDKIKTASCFWEWVLLSFISWIAVTQKTCIWSPANEAACKWVFEVPVIWYAHMNSSWCIHPAFIHALDAHASCISYVLLVYWTLIIKYFQLLSYGAQRFSVRACRAPNSSMVKYTAHQSCFGGFGHFPLMLYRQPVCYLCHLLLLISHWFKHKNWTTCHKSGSLHRCHKFIMRVFAYAAVAAAAVSEE